MWWCVEHGVVGHDCGERNLVFTPSEFDCFSVYMTVVEPAEQHKIVELVAAAMFAFFDVVDI